MYNVYMFNCIINTLLDLVLAAGSDRSLQVYDMNVMKWVWLTHDAHKRPVHYITQNNVIYLPQLFKTTITYTHIYINYIYIYNTIGVKVH